MNPDSEFMEYNKIRLISVFKNLITAHKKCARKFCVNDFAPLEYYKKISHYTALENPHQQAEREKKIFCLFKAIKQSLPI